MPEIKNPAGSFYIDSEDFSIERRETATGNRPVVKLAKVGYEIPDLSDKYLSTKLKGSPNGVAELDEGGKLLSNQLPSGIDKAEEYSTKENFPKVGKPNIIYIDLSTNLEYRWSGSTYVQIPTGLALGNTAETAFRGDHGEIIYNATINNKYIKDNPILTAKDLGAALDKDLLRPQHNTLVVEAYQEGLGYKATHTASEIYPWYTGHGAIFLRFDAPDGTGEQNYNFHSWLNGKALFRNPVKQGPKFGRYTVAIDDYANCEIIEDFEYYEPELKTDEMIQSVARDEKGKLWTKPGIQMDDINLSSKTVMSSIETVRRLAPIKTKKDGIVEMTPVEGYPLDIIAEINPIQAGENIPSITNIRDISGWDEILITLDNTIEQKEYRQTFGKTVYGGTYEPNRGKLIITLASKTFNGSENWQKIDRTVNGRTVFFKLNVPGLGANTNTMVQMCNIFKTAPISEPFTSDCVWAAGDDIYIGNQIVTQYGSDVNAFKAQLAKTNMQIVYELEKKQEEIVEQKKILAIEGRNVIQGSAGNVTVKAPIPGFDEEDINNVIFNFLQSEVGKELVKSIVNGQI